MIKPYIFKRFIAMTLFFLSVLSNGTIFAKTPEHNDPIKIVINNWTSQILLSKIVGRIFSTLGYGVEYHSQDMHEQWGALNRGLLHVQVEVWEGTNAKEFYRMVNAGGVVDAGTHEATTREEWWYPSYVEEICPGLPDWKALKDCYSAFAVPETEPFGRYLTGPWEKPDKARIRALGLKFKVIELKDGDALRDELIRAVREKRPIVLFNWTPNWVAAEIDGKFVEFPEYAPECETEPQWGINSELHHDCGNPKNGWLKKAAWSGMLKKWPCAFQILKEIKFSNSMLARLALEVDIENMKPDAAVTLWLETYKDLWKSWIPKICRQGH